MTDVSIMQKMSQQEAVTWKRQVGSAANELRRLLAEGYERRVWEALGYDSWNQCIIAIAEEFSFSPQHIRNLHSANETQKLIMSSSNLVATRHNGMLPERHLRPLTKLNSDELKREAWHIAESTAPNGKITGAHVAKVVDEMIHAPSVAHVSHNSGNNEWYTPPEYIEAARVLMGGIDTDPASSEIANKTVQAETYHTAEDDGLAWDWYGRVWMNPPYAQPLITEFCEKLAGDYRQGFITEACVLVNNATETRWFNALLDEASAVCFIRGRVKFMDPAGNPSGAPLQGQAILYFGDNVKSFSNCFKQFGSVLYARED